LAVSGSWRGRKAVTEDSTANRSFQGGLDAWLPKNSRSFDRVSAAIAAFCSIVAPPWH
jgi:hypothetical protein